MYLNIASYLYEKQIKSKMGNKLYLRIIFICVGLNWLDLHDCHTMPSKQTRTNNEVLSWTGVVIIVRMYDWIVNVELALVGVLLQDLIMDGCWLDCERTLTGRICMVEWSKRIASEELLLRSGCRGENELALTLNYSRVGTFSQARKICVVATNACFISVTRIFHYFSGFDTSMWE